MIYLQDISKNNGSGVWDFIYVVFQASRMGQCFDMIQISHIYISVYIHTGRVEADNQFSVDPSLAQTGQKKQGRFRNRRNGSSCNSNHSQQRHTYWWQKILNKNHHQTSKVTWCSIFFVIFWGPQDCSRWKQRQDVVFVVREKRHPVFTREAMVGAMVGAMLLVSWYPWCTLWQQ